MRGRSRLQISTPLMPRSADPPGSGPVSASRIVRSPCGHPPLIRRGILPAPEKQPDGIAQALVVVDYQYGLHAGLITDCTRSIGWPLSLACNLPCLGGTVRADPHGLRVRPVGIWIAGRSRELRLPSSNTVPHPMRLPARLTIAGPAVGGDPKQGAVAAKKQAMTGLGGKFRVGGGARTRTKRAAASATPRCRRSELHDRATIMLATSNRRGVKLAASADDQTGLFSRRALSGCEIVEHGFAPDSTRRRWRRNSYTAPVPEDPPSTVAP